MNQLRKAFEAFGHAAEGTLLNKGLDDTTCRIHDFIRRGRTDVAILVKKLEDKNEFANLTVETRKDFREREETLIDLLKYTAVEAYSNPFDVEQYADYLDEFSHDDCWMQAIHNFFCRSGYYSSLLSGKIVNPENIFRNFCNEFKKGKVEIKYLVALKNVEFSEPVLEFDKFYFKNSIQRSLRPCFKIRLTLPFSHMPVSI